MQATIKIPEWRDGETVRTADVDESDALSASPIACAVADAWANPHSKLVFGRTLVYGRLVRRGLITDGPRHRLTDKGRAALG